MFRELKNQYFFGKDGKNLKNIENGKINRMNRERLFMYWFYVCKIRRPFIDWNFIIEMQILEIGMGRSLSNFKVY